MNEQTALVPQGGGGQYPSAFYRPDEWGEEETGGLNLDFKEIRAILFRQRYWIAATIAVTLLLGFAATMLMTPKYEATASVQIEEHTPIVTKGQEAVGPEVTAANVQRYTQSQIDVLKSRNLAGRIAQRLRVAGNPAMLDAIGVRPEPGEGWRTTQERVVGALMKNVAVEVPFGSQLARISFTSRDGGVSATIANAYAENLITGNLERRYQSSSYARDFLSKELGLAKQRLAMSERAALAYARDAQIVNTGGGGGGDSGSESAPVTSLSAASLVQMNGALAEARTRRIQTEQRWRSAAGTPAMSLPEVISNGTVQGLQAERARLGAALQKLRQTYLDDYPEVARLNAEIASVDGDIAATAGRIRASIRGEYETAARQEGSMAGRMGGLKTATLQDQDARVQFDILNRESATNRTLYDGLLQRFSEVSTAASVTNNSINILDAAVAPSGPVSPRPFINMALALIGGIATGLVIAFIRERLDDSIRSPDDVLKKLQLPLLGTTPVVVGGSVQQQLGRSRSPLSESYHSVRSALEFSRMTGVPRTLLVTSSRAGEGKSTTSLAIAAEFAHLDRRVLLVDADLRLPSLDKVLSVPNERGFVHALTGRMSLAELVVPFDNLDFLPSGPIPPNPTELLAPHMIRAFLGLAMKDYDLVVFDGPPVMGLADCPQIARVVEGAVLVVEATRAHRGQVKTAIRRLRAANATILGVVLTKFSPKSSGYSDNYGYQYQYGAITDEAKAATAA